jgi:photosystem II stability/assembly factor-like uncharacterized protein
MSRLGLVAAALLRSTFLCTILLTLMGSVLIGVRRVDAEWFQQNNPRPQGNSLSSVAMPNAQTVIAVSGGSVVKSTDAGATWTIQNVQSTGSSFNLVDVSCADANTCMAVGTESAPSGYAAITVSTTDGWATWITTQQTFGYLPILNGVSCTDAHTCTAVGSAREGNSYPGQSDIRIAIILRTADGGATWTQQSAGPATYLDGVSCTDGNTCTAVGGYWRSAPALGDGYILRTIDGGITWTTQYTASGEGRVTAVSCAGAITCVALQGGSNQYAPARKAILRTTDGGATWTVSANLYPSIASRVSCPDATTCTVVGSTSGVEGRNSRTGLILRTADSGATWVQQSSGTANSLAGVSFSDANTGTAVGEAGTILRTSDGGATWVEQSSGTTTLNAVSFTDANTGTAVGEAGTILRTTDGGATWVKQSSGTTQTLYAVSFTGANTGTAVGEAGTILRTTDGGATWVEQSSGTMRVFHGISCTDANTCTAVGFESLPGQSTDAIIVNTTDGGLTWIQARVTASYLFGVSCTDANACTAVGGNTYGYILIMRTTDGGATWTTPASGAAIDIIRGVSCTDFNTCAAAVGLTGGSRVVVRTTDGWASWTTQSVRDFYLSAISCTDANTCTAVGHRGAIVRTTDGWNTWTTESSGSIRDLFGISCTDANTCTAVGENGTVLRTATSQPVTYALAVTKNGNGNGTVTSSSSPAGASEIGCGTSCTATYASGTVVTLTAEAAIGSTFITWAGCDAVSGTTCTVTMAAARSVTATFALQQFTLSVSKDGIGSGTVTSSSNPAGATEINCGVTCSVAYDWNTVVTLLATSAFGNVFVRWSGCDAVSGTSCIVTMSSAKSVTATFIGIPPTPIYRPFVLLSERFTFDQFEDQEARTSPSSSP